MGKTPGQNAEWEKQPNGKNSRMGKTPGQNAEWGKQQGPTRIRTGDDGFANRCLSQLGDRARN